MRQLVLDQMPDLEGRIILSGSQFRYVVNVLRSEEGLLIDTRLPDGSLRKAKIEKIDRVNKHIFLLCSLEDSNLDSSNLAVGSSMPPLTSLCENFVSIVLFQWILKGPKMDQVIRQATETGVTLIVPVAGDRCLSRDPESLGLSKTSRWERIVTEARQQSGSPVSTIIHQPVLPEEILGVWKGKKDGKSGLPFVLTEAPLARKSLHEYCYGVHSHAAIAIGPEGGMSPRELELLDTAGFYRIHFNTNILRAETAALYGIAAVQTLLTESEKWQLKE